MAGALEKLAFVMRGLNTVFIQLGVGSITPTAIAIIFVEDRLPMAGNKEEASQVFTFIEMAGRAGFEPASSVLETDSLAAKLTDLKKLFSF